MKKNEWKTNEKRMKKKITYHVCTCYKIENCISCTSAFWTHTDRIVQILTINIYLLKPKDR